MSAAATSPVQSGLVIIGHSPQVQRLARAWRGDQAPAAAAPRHRFQRIVTVMGAQAADYDTGRGR